MIDNFMNPEAFLLLIPLLIHIVLRFFLGRGFKFTSHYVLEGIKGSFKQKIIIVPDIIMYLLLILLVTAIARPQNILKQSYNVTEGVAMEIVIDRSSSMSNEILYQDEWQPKLEIVKQLFTSFVHGDGKDLEGRPMDLIGLIYFAKYPETVMPLSLQHDILTDYLQYIQVAKTRAEDGTAIGDALLLAASRLKQYETYQQSESDYKITSRVIILLTDGENTAGTISPSAAAAKAAAWGIKIYSIAINSDQQSRTYNDFNRVIRNMLPPRAIDERFLRDISGISGGKYWIARDSNDLIKIYREIDKMEKSRIKYNEFTEARELYHYFLFISFLLLIVYILLRHLVFRRLQS
jgi:Ca-activated chloride channel homolog